MTEIRASKADIWIGGGLLAFCAFAAWRTLRIKQGFTTSVAGPAFLPWVMVVALALLGAVLILRALYRRRAADAARIAMPDRRTALRLAAFAGLLAAYSAAFFPIGYIPSTLGAFVLGLLLIGERKPWLLIAFPVVMTGAVYLAFTKLLSVWLP